MSPLTGEALDSLASRLVRSIADGSLDDLAARSGMDHLTDIVGAAVGLESPQYTDRVLESLWRRFPSALPVFAAAVHVSPHLAVGRLATWSGRIRVRGLGALCPLVARALDGARSPGDRAEAALAAWDLFADEGALGVLRSMGAPEPPAIPAYYRYSRPEVVDRVPLGARRVLDVGCAAGRLGFAVKSRQPAEVAGIELDPAAASEARRILDSVLVADLDVAEPDLSGVDGPFDALVTADVLEHVRDPWSLLARLATLVRPGGVVVVSIPNVSSLSVLAPLAAGRFDYVPAGILDRTHLRFFTCASAIELVESAGLSVESVESVRDPFLPEISAESGPDGVSLTAGPLRLSGLDALGVEDLTTVQYVLVARRRGDPAVAAQPSVWDCVMIDDELDMLEARLTELDGLVDHVVVVEGDRTFRGEPKPLHFDRNRSRFARYPATFHHLPVTLPESADPWARERLQRDALVGLATGIPDDDVVLFCDVDEIVSRAALERIVAATASGPVALDMALYYYSLRWRSPQHWSFAKAFRARDLPASVEWLRLTGVRARSGLPEVPEAGWHLSYFGGSEAVHKKLRAYSHSEFDTDDVHSRVPDLITGGTTVHGIDLVEVDDPFPAHIVERFETRPSASPSIVAASVATPSRAAASNNPTATFTEQWYPPGQLADLADLLRAVIDAGVEGDLVEIGCWEGRSTVELAAVCGGRRLHAVDWWLGNLDEGPDHPSVVATALRDVYGTFLSNVAPFPHVAVHRQDGAEFLEEMARTGRRIAFLHLDAGHTYGSTKALIDLALPLVVPGGVVCGDDYLNAHAGRADLGGGVERAVTESFHGEASNSGNLWLYRRPTDGGPPWWPAA